MVVVDGVEIVDVEVDESRTLSPEICTEGAIGRPPSSLLRRTEAAKRAQTAQRPKRRLELDTQASILT